MELPTFFKSQEKYAKAAKDVVKDFTDQYVKDLKIEIPRSPIMQKNGLKQVDSKIESVVRKSGNTIIVETTLTGNYAKATKFPEFEPTLPEKIKPERIGDSIFKRLREKTR